MLYLNPPYRVIDDLTLFPDHRDPATFYYLALRPHLSMSVIDGKRSPSFSFLKYVDDTPDTPKGGGFLNFQVDLGVSEAVKAKVRKKLADMPGITKKENDLSLEPVRLVDGTASLILFDAPAAGSPGKAGDGFVERLQAAARPALFGDNQAIFSASLTEKGAQMVERSLDLEMSPIGVVYNLEYLGLKPAYKFKVTADWTEVAKSFAERHRARFIGTLDISKTTQELVDKRVIKIEADTFITAQESQSATDRQTMLLKQLTDLLIARFFEPKVNPAAPERKTGALQGVVDSIGQLYEMMGGGVYSYSQHKAEVSMKANLSAEASERVAIKQLAGAMTFLDGIARTMRDVGVDLKDYVKPITLNDPFFKRRTVKVVPRADFAGYSVASMDVDLVYKGEKKPVHLDKSTDTAEVVWPAATGSDGRMARDVGISYKVNFLDDKLAGQRPAVVVHAQENFTDDVYEIFPYRDLFRVQTIPIEASADFPWDRYPRVEVDVRYIDEPNGIRIERKVVLQKEAPKADVQLFIRNFAHTAYDFEVLYRGNLSKGVRDEVRDWTSSRQAAIEIRNPLPQQRRLGVYADSVNWEQVSRIVLDLQYDDDAASVHEKGKLTFPITTDAAGGPLPAGDARRYEGVFAVNLANAAQRDIKYTLTVMPKNADREIITGSVTRADELFLGEYGGAISGQRYVRLQLAPGAFGKGCAKITVDVRHTDPVTAFSKSREFQFTQNEPPSEWVYPFSAKGTPGYEYKIKYWSPTNKLLAETPAAVNTYTPGGAFELTVPLKPAGR